MNWQEACDHPGLHNLPFKIELNEFGQVLMSPVKVYHSAYQGEISYLLRMQSRKGKALTECAIHTPVGTKVADVAWASPDTFQKIRSEIECSQAPELCIEVLSSSNTAHEITFKTKLYFEAGALEVWVCDENGRIQFYRPSGQIPKSGLFPNFPVQLDV